MITKQEIPSLEEAASNRNLVEAAIRAFFNLAGTWNLSEDERRRLLGGIAKSTLYEWLRQPQRTISTDTVTRISLLLGIHAALVRLFPNAPSGRMAERIRQRLDLSLTSGLSLLEYLLRGGIPAMADARRFFETEAGGGLAVGLDNESTSLFDAAFAGRIV